MSRRIVRISDHFWNIRGDFKIGGVLNIGTHASLVRRASGKFLFLDAYTLPDDIKAEVDAVTNGGDDIEAIINLHPFHTVHIERAHAQYPGARLYGTRRHVEKFPDLPWESALTESDDCAAEFESDLSFSIPAGVDFISRNENLHFSSVLAYHRASQTIHVDDTLMYMGLPGPLGALRKPAVSFHPTLAQTLERRADAADEFEEWARDLAVRWGDAENLCAAHAAALRGSENKGAPVAKRIRAALKKVRPVLWFHRKRFSG